MKDEYAASFNWREHLMLTSLLRPASETVAHMLTLMNGRDEWGFALWTITEGDFSKIGFSAEPEEFLQSAGNSTAMTIEIRRQRPDGEFIMFAVSKPQPIEGTREIQWGSNPDRQSRIEVPAAEVFSAAEAAAVYAVYYSTADVPEGYRLRDLHLTGGAPAG